MDSFILFFLGWKIQERGQSRMTAWSAGSAIADAPTSTAIAPATVAGRSTLASADEVDARPRSTSSLTRRAVFRSHSYYRNAPYALCYSSGLSFRSPNYLTTA